MYSVQSTVDNVQCTEYSLLLTIYSIFTPRFFLRLLAAFSWAMIPAMTLYKTPRNDGLQALAETFDDPRHDSILDFPTSQTSGTN